MQSQKEKNLLSNLLGTQRMGNQIKLTGWVYFARVWFCFGSLRSPKNYTTIPPFDYIKIQALFVVVFSLSPIAS
jgi:hypothetical protein